MDRVARFRGLPRAIRTDQGPEFTGKALDQWAYEHGVELRLIEAGKPTQNAYIESFNGKSRDEYLRALVQDAQRSARDRESLPPGLQQGRPHSALKYQTPAEFAAAWRSHHAGSAKHTEQADQVT